MTKTNKRNLIIVAVVLSVALIAAVCVSVFFPKTTIASLLHLTSKDQIKQITISSLYIANVKLFSDDSETIYSKQLDITGTPLGKQYIDTIFSKPIIFQDSGTCPPLAVQGTDYKAVTVKLTIDGGDDAPIIQTDISLGCCAFPELCDVPEIYLSYDYTTDYLRKQFEENNERGIQEEIKQEQSYIFTIPGDELFTSAFINEQLGVGD